MNLCGRKVLKTSYESVTADNVIDILKDVMQDFNRNRAEIDYLYNYRRGKQPILNRTKKVRDDIINIVLENHADEIVSFKKGYVFGEPVQYVRRKVGSTDGVSEEAIDLLNELMAQTNKADCDEELADWMLVCGTAYRKMLGNASDIQIDVCDPRDTAVVYYSGFGRRPMMSIERVILRRNGEDVLRYYIYTDNRLFVTDGTAILSEEAHALGHIPVIEYPANNIRMGAFECVILLLDAINTLSSNRVDDIEQQVQAFMKFINVNIDEEDFYKFKEMGALKFKSDPGNPADVDLVSKSIDQTQPQALKDDLLENVYTICGMPDRQGQNRTSGDTGQAVVLRDGWAAAETKAKEIESMFVRSERVFVSHVCDIMGGALPIKPYDVTVKFRPNKTDNLLTKTQALQNLLESHIHPLRAIETIGLFADPEQIYADSEEYYAKAAEESRAEQIKALADAFAKLMAAGNIDPADAFAVTGLVEDPEAAAKRGAEYDAGQEDAEADRLSRMNNVQTDGQDDTETE